MEPQQVLKCFFGKLWKFHHVFPYIIFVFYTIVGSGLLYGIEYGFWDFLDISEPMVVNGTKCMGINDYWAAMFYVLSLCTTIGFGNIYVCSVAAKMLSLLYSLFALPLFAFIAVDLSCHLADVLAKLHTRHMSHWIKRLRRSTTEREAAQAMLDTEPPDPEVKPQTTGNRLAWAEEDLEDEECETEDMDTGESVRSIKSETESRTEAMHPNIISTQQSSGLPMEPAPVWFPVLLLGVHLFLMTLYVFATEPGTYWTAIYRTLLTFLAADYYTRNFYLAIPTFLFIFIGLILVACFIMIVYRHASIHIERTKSTIRMDARDKIVLLQADDSGRSIDNQKHDYATEKNSCQLEANVEANALSLQNPTALDDQSLVEQIVYQQIPSKVWRTALQWKMGQFVDCYKNESAKAVQTQESLEKMRTVTHDAFVEPATPIQHLDSEIQCAPMMKDVTSETLVSTISSTGIQCCTENQTSATSPRQVLVTSLATQVAEQLPDYSQQQCQTDPLKELVRKVSQSMACQHPDPPQGIISSSAQTNPVESSSAEIQTDVIPDTPKKESKTSQPASQSKKPPGEPEKSKSAKPSTSKTDKGGPASGQKAKASPRPSPSTSKDKDLSGSEASLRTSSQSPARQGPNPSGAKRGKSPTSAGSAARGGAARGRGQTPPSRGARGKK